MVAPIDSKVTLTVGDGDDEEEFTLRLNFRGLKLAKTEGVNLMTGDDMDPIDMAVAVRCLAVADHPKMTDEEAFALAVRHGDKLGDALSKLFAEFGGGDEGNGRKRVKRRPTKRK